MSADVYQAQAVLSSIVGSCPEFALGCFNDVSPQTLHGARQRASIACAHLLTGCCGSSGSHPVALTACLDLPWRSDDSGYSVLWESDVFDTRQTLIAEQMALGSHTGPRVCVCQRLDCMAAKRKQSYPRLKVIQKRHNYSTIHPAIHTIAYGPPTLAQNMQL